MIPYANLIDCTYLPKINTIEDDSNLQELNVAYQFATTNKFRAFCTYSSLIPFIESKNYVTRLASVIDFPEGKSISCKKIFEAGIAYKICQKSSASELDVVLHPQINVALQNILDFTNADINSKIGIKYIIELGHRSKEDIQKILQYLDSNKCKYVKTNTGRLADIPFEEKLDLVEWLSTQTNRNIKVSGGIKTPKMLGSYKEILKDRGIYGISYSTLKEW